MYTLFYIRELISLLLVLELIAVLYYFFFLNYIDLKSFTLVKYKYLLGVYILMSYLVTLLFCLGMFGLSFLYGTLNYRELSYLTLNLNWACYLLLCAFFLKLGLPSLHFFKLELYQFINFNLLYLYSILSLLLTLYIYFFFYYTFFFCFVNTLTYLSFFIFFGSIFLLLRSLHQITFYQFIAFSGLFTASLVCGVSLITLD